MVKARKAPKAETPLGEHGELGGAAETKAPPRGHRGKKSAWWILTYSPPSPPSPESQGGSGVEGEVEAEEVSTLTAWCESNCSRYYMVKEYEGRAHIHVAMELMNQYGLVHEIRSDKASRLKPLEVSQHALDWACHDDLRFAVGYCMKDLNRTVKPSVFLGSKGFSDEYLKESNDIYQRGVVTKRVHKFCARRIVITPNRLPDYMGCALVEHGAGHTDELMAWLTQHNFAFAQADPVVVAKD